MAKEMTWREAARLAQISIDEAWIVLTPEQLKTLRILTERGRKQ